MRYLLLYALSLLFLANITGLQAQDLPQKGTVSYLTSQNVYVKFPTTEAIGIGDTLFIRKEGNLVPALLVTNKSSVSCVCSKVFAGPFRVGDEIWANETPVKKIEEDKAKEGKPAAPKTAAKPPVPDNKAAAKKRSKQKVKARISAASYTNLSDRGDKTRMRYSFNLQGNHINNSPFSTDAYITFRHTLGEWDSTRAHLKDAIKIYSLSAKYDFDSSTSLVLGRKINPKISSLGAVDGVQFEKGIGPFLVGAIAGSRPDLRDYSINLDLVQAGLYVGHDSRNNEKYQQTTLGVIEQRNKSAVDRRFVYLQHSDDLLKNLNLFGSCEIDLYEKINNETKNKPSLTNLFASLQYRLSRKMSVNLSYDNRKNIIYYESYKSYIDQLIDNETRQGFRLGLNVRPWKLVSFGANASWRFQKSGANGSKNLNTYLNFNRLPLLKTSVSLTANFLQTSYIDSKIYGVRWMKDFFKGKANAEIYYRRVEYDYTVYGYTAHQDVAGGSLSFQVLKGLGIYLFVEKTFDSQNNDYMMINTKIMQRF